jgi:hypothetical protein
MGGALDGRLEQILAAREQLEARHAEGLLTLLAEREELRGVYALADQLGERVLWCA